MRSWTWFVLAAVLGAPGCGPRPQTPVSPAIGEADVPHDPAPLASAKPAAAIPGSAPVPVETPPTSSDDGRARIPDDFPVGTRSLKVREVAHVFDAPSDAARYIGKIVGGTRVAWNRVVTPDPRDPSKRPRPVRCAAWVEILPRGWLCKSLLAPSSDAPGGVPQPVLKAGRGTPDDYFKVMTDDTKAYKTEDDVRSDTVDKVVSTKVMVVGTGVVHVGETPYLKTDHGLIEASRLAKFWPSDFAGLVLAEHPGLAFPFAWVFFERGAKGPPIYGTADLRDEPLRKAARREVVPVLEERDGSVRIGEGQWIARKSLRVARLTAPPDGLGDGEQWIDVDRDEQVLIAYQGLMPVFATLVATGRVHDETPLATYRVRAKAATTSMDGDPTVPNRYEVSAVPWAVRFAKGLFIHGAYWHDGFGGARSHGCVNVSPRDGAFLFGWVTPAVPDGWSEVEVPMGTGPMVRIRNGPHPVPPMFDYSREEPTHGR